VSETRSAVLLLNWNGWRDTLECLESVFRCNPAGHPVVVCDNDSQDGSLERIRAWADGELPVEAESEALRGFSQPLVRKPIGWVELDREAAERGGDSGEAEAPLVLIRTGGNLGFAGGLNVGLRYLLAQPSVSSVWLLNNDTVVRPDALGHLLAEVATDERIGICGSTILHYYDPDRVQALAGGSYEPRLALTRMLGASLPAAQARTEEIGGRLDYVTGASMLVTRRFLEEVGLMSEDYFLYFEELDWATRGRGRFRLGWARDSVVYHREGSSIGTRGSAKSPVADYHFLRNRLRFTRRHHPAALGTVRLALFVALLRRLLRGQPGRAGMILRLLREEGRT
jgi:GT2 family glycosyltransferase